MKKLLIFFILIISFCLKDVHATEYRHMTLYSDYPFGWDSSTGNYSSLFTIPADSSISWSERIWVSPAANNISTEIVEKVMYEKYNPMPYVHLTLCASSPKFNVIQSSYDTSCNNLGCIVPNSIKLVQSDTTCYMTSSDGTQTYEAYVYHLFFNVERWSVNTTAEMFDLMYWIGITNYSEDSRGNPTPLLFYLMDYQLTSDVEEYTSYATAFGTIEQAKHTENIYEEIVEYNDIVVDKFNAIINKIDDPFVDDSSFGSFFNNFVDIDHGGISAIVTSPVRLISSLNNTCTPVSFNIFNKGIELPCGTDIFWNRSDVTSFRKLWNILFGGAIVYALLRKMFIVIQNLKDPDNDKVEVMEL